jgi:hypothetical protein
MHHDGPDQQVMSAALHGQEAEMGPPTQLNGITL